MWQSFIVLGIIPGTNIQTDLNFWLVLNALFILFMTRRFWRAMGMNLRIRFIAWRLSYTFDHASLSL